MVIFVGPDIATCKLIKKLPRTKRVKGSPLLKMCFQKIYFAAQQNSSECLKFLLEKGADITTQLQWGKKTVFKRKF